jgi:hypothetical protein
MKLIGCQNGRVLIISGQFPSHGDPLPRSCWHCTDYTHTGNEQMFTKAFDMIEIWKLIYRNSIHANRF